MANSVEITGKKIETSKLDQVIQIGRTRRIREEIGFIADRTFREGLINREAYDGYEELAEGREKFDLDEKMLNKIRQDAAKYEVLARKVFREIEYAKRAGAASEGDLEHIMKNWVIDNINFIADPQRVMEKLDRLRREKNRYDKVLKHPLAKPGKGLALSASENLKIPTHEEYLKMTVPERRKFLDKFEKDIQKAETYAEQEAEKGKKGRVLEYQGKLFEARRNGLIGATTFHKFLNGFKTLKDKGEEEYWLEEFDGQMERYQELWDDAKTELDEASFKKMKSMIDSKGYTQLLDEFGKLKEATKEKMVNDYSQTIGYYKTHGVVIDGEEQGVIGNHTFNEYMQWIEGQNLKEGRSALDQIPQQMERYKNLWEQSKKLSRKQQRELRGKINSLGYTELKAEFQRLQQGEASSQNGKNKEAYDILNQIDDQRAQAAILEAEELLDEQGANQKKTFAGVLKRIFKKQNRNQFDATKFEDQVRGRVVENKKKLEEEAQVEPQRFEKNPLLQFQADDDEIDVEEGIDILEDSGESEITERDGMIQVETWDEDEGKVHREAQFVLNSKEGIQKFLAEDQEHHYQSEASGGRDDVSLAFEVGSQTLEMDYATIEDAADYLELKSQAATNGEDYEEEKAA